VVIDVSGEAPYFAHLLKKDPAINVQHRRLYIDIFGAKLSDKVIRAIPINDGLLKVARAGQYSKETVRVVLDIESIDDYKVFALSEPFRIVIDVIGEKRGAPQREEKAVKAVPSEPEAAGEKTALQPHRVRKIVIDPGHGGKDPGAVGRTGLEEKGITLKVSRLLADRLSKETGASVVMTRSDDVYIPLEERTAIANTRSADLFVSIHVNASPNRDASGVETYFLDVAHDKRSIEVAAMENQTTTKAAGDLQFILNDLIRTANRNDSSRLAEAIQSALVGELRKGYDNVNSYGVKGAPFYVLVRTNMPSVLVEISFISNAMEEKRLKDDAYLDSVVEGIAQGVLLFINGNPAGGAG
jgi:N-acetylmuramoyl-L-alanine amidase